MAKKKKILIGALCGLAFLGIGITGLVIALNYEPSTFRLDDEYYGESEMIELYKDEYEKLIAEQKTFVVMIDKVGCKTTETMRDNMASFPDDLKFKYYRMMWSEVRESSLHEYVKFTPSVAIIYKGKVKAWLQADRDEDSEYFNSAEALKQWLQKYIIF